MSLAGLLRSGFVQLQGTLSGAGCLLSDGQFADANRSVAWSAIEFLPREAMLSLLFTWATIITSRANFSVFAYFCTWPPKFYYSQAQGEEGPTYSLQLAPATSRRQRVCSAATHYRREPTHRPARELAMPGVSTPVCRE